MPMNFNTQHYRQKGWQVFPSILATEEVETVRHIGVSMRLNASKYSGWKGISCASKFDETLFMMYTNPLMKYLSTQLLGPKVHLFNDQIVVKLPNDNFTFPEHYDNQFGPNSKGFIHTVNLSWILDDINDSNGGLHVKNKDDGEWVKLNPKKGDIVAINGNTYHRSGENNTNMTRGLYACVYTEKPIHLEGPFYTEEFK